MADPQTLAATVELLHRLKIRSMTEARIFCAAIAPTTLSEIVKRQKLPFTTVSAAASWMATRGLLSIEPHPTDGRKKIVTANLRRVA